MADSVVVQELNATVVGDEAKVATRAPSKSVSLSKAPRVTALDFTKGALVVIMSAVSLAELFLSESMEMFTSTSDSSRLHLSSSAEF